jgi:hypothetical protein
VLRGIVGVGVVLPEDRTEDRTKSSQTIEYEMSSEDRPERNASVCPLFLSSEDKPTSMQDNDRFRRGQPEDKYRYREDNAEDTEDNPEDNPEDSQRTARGQRRTTPRPHAFLLPGGTPDEYRSLLAAWG